jgi:hypothetical protein
MFTLETLTAGLSLVGIDPAQVVTTVAAVPVGSGAVQAIYKTADGELKERLLTRADEPSISIATAEQRRSFDGDGANFKLAVEAKRIDLAFLFDPMMAVHTSNVQPLPHQTNIQVDDTLLLIDLDRQGVRAGQPPARPHERPRPDLGGRQPSGPGLPGRSESKAKPPRVTAPPGEPKARFLIGTVAVKAATAKMRLVQIAEEILRQLVSSPQAVMNMTVEINAEFPNGVSDQVKRAVSENATILGFKNKTWE